MEAAERHVLALVAHGVPLPSMVVRDDDLVEFLWVLHGMYVVVSRLSLDGTWLGATLDVVHLGLKCAIRGGESVVDGAEKVSAQFGSLFHAPLPPRTTA
jgi:hypothetical protein